MTGNLGAAGWYLEQDYGVQCGVASDDNELTGRYKDYWVFVAVMATFYSLGVPILFMILVYKFKYHATQGGDKVVMGALGWMFSPFRDGKEWWLGAEHVNNVCRTSRVR